MDTFKYDTWYAATASFSFWCLFYYSVRRLLPQRSPEYCSRVITVFHGCFTAVCGLNQCFTEKSVLADQDPTTNEQSFILAVSFGYFLEDLIWCLYYQTETALMIAHHTYSCFALARVLFTGFAGHAVTCGLGALEVTNPLLQARWFVRTYGYHATPLFTSIELTFMLMFFLVRIVLGTIFLMMLMVQPKITWEFRFLAVFIYVMSWMFCVNISKYFSHKYLEQNIEADLAHINTS